MNWIQYCTDGFVKLSDFEFSEFSYEFLASHSIDPMTSSGLSEAGGGLGVLSPPQ